MSSIFMGIDPGLGGGMAAITPEGLVATAMPRTERDIWDWICNYGCPYDNDKPTAITVIEHQDPRPTYWVDKATKRPKQSILRSTVLLYGSYMSLRAMIIAAGITLLEDVPAKRWQSSLNIVPRKKGESASNWKSRLKSRAQQLHPEVKVTLSTADAILLAEYCMILYNKSENREKYIDLSE